MNYCYLYINKLDGQDKIDLFGQLKKSIQVLKDTEKTHGSIHIFSDSGDHEIKQFSKEQGIFCRPIIQSRDYKSPGILNILVEKIIQLRDFDSSQDVVLLDVDTVFTNLVPANFWDDNAVLWSAEYYITQFRNLGNVLPYLPWHEIGIDYSDDFVMYNTGVVYVPKDRRKEICEKALWITDYLNNGKFLPSDRYGNKLDEQIGLSIAIHDAYGKQRKIKTCENFIHHYWNEKDKGYRWWE